MPALCGMYPSISPWNIRELEWGDYVALVQHANEMNKPREGGK